MTLLAPLPQTMSKSTPAVAVGVGLGWVGPVFVQGPVTVVGHDVYGLDADGDGIAVSSRRH